MLKEFKEFALKGNLIDMAVGIVIGAAFSTIVKSLVDDIVMPVVGYFSGGIDFKEKFITLGDGNFATLSAAQEAGAAVITYGNFISAVISFIIVAWVLFIVVKGMNRAQEAMAKEAAEAEEAAEPSDEVKLLTEIRDSLSK